MFPDEEEIRRELSRRVIRPGREAWLDVRKRLESRRPARRPGILALAAATLVLLAAILWRRPAPPLPENTPSRGFQVSRVESGGRPSAAMVLRPDQNTLMVIVPD